MKEDQTSNEKFAYDEVGYPGYVLPQTHPDSFAAIAKLHGMNPAPPEKCRVLELGCGNGTNLSWLACNLPQSEFIGVDLAKMAISEAQRNAEDLKLQNISFVQQDVLEINENTFGKFDYIIAHGLLSWVPEIVRQKVLSLYSELLNPHGVGFISYNVYPGFYRRQIIRDLINLYSQRFEKPLEKVEQGVAFLDFLSKNTGHLPLYQEILKHEFEGMADRPFENIYHDDVAEFNHPFYFTEFIAEAEKNDLKFLSESEYFSPYTKDMPEEVVQVFENISRNLTDFEQYSDFFYCRRFRQTLLCKKDVNLETNISPSKIKEIYISTVLKPTSPTIDLNPNSFLSFLDSTGKQIDISHNLTKVVLANLIRQGSHPIKFDDLIKTAINILESQGVTYEEPEKEVEITASLLFQLYSPRAIRFHHTKADFVDYVSDKPVIDKFAHWQVKNQAGLAINHYGVSLTIQDDFIRKLWSLLDGTRTRDDLIAELTEFLRSGEEMEDKAAFIAKLPEIVNQNLFVLAKMGFLVE